MLAHEVCVDPAVRDQLVLDAVQKRQVGAVANRQVHVRLLRDLRAARVDEDQPRRIRAAQPVEDAHPEHRVRFGDVVADGEDRVAEVEVVHRAWVAVRPEGFLQREIGGRGAESGVAVQVRRPDAGSDDEREGVVVLEEKLASVVEAEAKRPLLVQHLPRLLDDDVHRLVPGGGLQLAFPADERLGQPVMGAVRLPAEQALRAEAAVVDAIDGAAANPDDPARFDGDVHPAVHRAKHARRLHPSHIRFVDAFIEKLVDPRRPCRSGQSSAGSPTAARGRLLQSECP